MNFSELIISSYQDKRPDEVLTRDGKIYLKRWHILRDYGKQNIYLHEFVGNDNDEALHNHPWQSCSIVLKGQYKEFLRKKLDENTYQEYDIIRSEGDVIFRNAEDYHRIELIDNQPSFTLFITGEKTNEWGFLCPQGFTHWERFEKNNGCS